MLNVPAFIGVALSALPVLAVLSGTTTTLVWFPPTSPGLRAALANGTETTRDWACVDVGACGVEGSEIGLILSDSNTGDDVVIKGEVLSFEVDMDVKATTG